MTESLKAHFVQRERTGGGGQRERDKDQRGSRTLPPRSRESVAPLLHHQRPQPDQPHVPVFSQGEPVGPPRPSLAQLHGAFVQTHLVYY